MSPVQRKKTVERPSDKAEIELLRQKLGELVSKDIEKAAKILAGWLGQSSQVKKKKAA